MPKSNEPSKIDTIANPPFGGQNGDCAMVQPTCLPLETQREVALVFSWDYLNNVLINLSRTMLAGLVTFEALNVLGILQYHVSFHWIALLITTGGAWCLLELIFFNTRNSNQSISNVLMLTAVLALYADTLGQVYFLFDKIIWYDQVLHFFAGGVLCAAIIFLLIQNLKHRKKMHLGIISIAFFAWTTTVSLGLLYEFGEYILDSITGSNSLVGLSDTIDDLMLDNLGSLLILMLLVIYFYYARSVKIRQIESQNGDSIKDDKK